MTYKHIELNNNNAVIYIKIGLKDQIQCHLLNIICGLQNQRKYAIPKRQNKILIFKNNQKVEIVNLK